MKTFAKISLLVLFVFITSCSKSDESPKTEAKIDGEWNLKYVNGSFSGASYYFEPGVINWKFDPNNSTVTVENNNTNTGVVDVLPSGVYSYEIIESNDPNSCSQIIKIDEIEMGCLTVEESDLTINQTFADGFQVHLVRYSL